MTTNLENIELKLRNIVNENKPKYITINKQRIYISRPILDYLRKLVKEGENLPLHLITALSSKQEEIRSKEGGVLPFFLIPLLTGIGAAGAVAGGAAGIASAVNSKKAEDERNRLHAEQLKLEEQKNKEIERHNVATEETMKSLKQGMGVEIKNFGRKNNMSELEIKLLKGTLKPLLNKLDVSSYGNGIFLYPKGSTSI